MGSMNPQGINFYEVHAVSKNVMYVIEGLDAALRSLDCAIERHSRLYEQYRSQIGRTTHDALLYRREMFHSTRLRMSSAQQRLGNIINLVRFASHHFFFRVYIPSPFLILGKLGI